MKIVIPGGSGQVGTLLARAFTKDGHRVTVLSRNPVLCTWHTAKWDGKSLGNWVEQIDGADVVINLAGYSVDCRYNQKNRDLIMNSRIDSTRVIGKAIQQCDNPPKTWLQACTATIYKDSYEKPNDEFTGIIGGDETNVPDTWNFSIDVATSWERTLDEAKVPHHTQSKAAFSIILNPDSGSIFDILLRLVRFGTLGLSR